MLEHENIKRTRYKWKVEGGSYKTVLVIETDLEVNPDGTFDSSTLDDIVDMADQEMKGRAIDGIEILPRSARDD
jgi:hypothetical protein